jgi:hypothetical protein
MGEASLYNQAKQQSYQLENKHGVWHKIRVCATCMTMTNKSNGAIISPPLWAKGSPMQNQGATGVSCHQIDLYQGTLRRWVHRELFKRDAPQSCYITERTNS